MNSDTYGAIKRDQQKIIDKYEAIVAELKAQLESVVFKQAAIKICYDGLKTILDENACPDCGYNDGDHEPGCGMYEIIATMRDIVEGDDGNES